MPRHRPAAAAFGALLLPRPRAAVLGSRPSSQDVASLHKTRTTAEWREALALDAEAVKDGDIEHMVRAAADALASYDAAGADAGYVRRWRAGTTTTRTALASWTCASSAS